MIEYRKGSLFEAPKGSYLVHACNTQGVWGSGIATEFKKRFPHAFAVYSRHCQNNSNFVLGQFWAIWDADYYVTCLLVSSGYGRQVDSKEEIKKQTKIVLDKFLQWVTDPKQHLNAVPVTEVYSNKFNSGFFRVPWNETEAILMESLKPYNIKWIVYDPDLKT